MARVLESPDSQESAAIQIQRISRGFLARLEALRLVNIVYEKIYDPRTNGYYYYNTRTFWTSWKPPGVVTRVLGEFGDLDNIAPTYTEEEAAIKIQAAWRQQLAIRIMRAKLASVMTKLLDESTGIYYYYNNITGETSWSKSALLGTEDIEDFPPESLCGVHKGKQDVLDSEQLPNSGFDSEQMGTSGHEGWQWDESIGWYYDEEFALNQNKEHPAMTRGVSNTSGGKEGSAKASRPAESGSDESSILTDSDNEEGGAAAHKRRHRTLRVAPRQYPRSKAQKLIDEAEDSIEGARLSSLDLSDLDMTRVSSRVYDLDWLESLDLSRNCLTRVSPDLAALDNLLELDLRCNRLGTIPDELEALTRLQHLRVGYNRITTFRGNIYLISSLRTLDLSHNRMKEVPLQVGDLQLLKRTREWEIGLRLLANLEALDLSHNQLENWPAQVEGCSTLRDLRLDHNQLHEVPGELGDNSALTNLSLGSNSIKQLPAAINSLSSLVSLDVSWSGLEIIEIQPTGRKERGPRLSSLERLSLEHNQLRKPPVAIESLTTLVDLNLSCNPLDEWDVDFTRLRKMKCLRLREVNLKRCPRGLGGMDKLETLNLANNRIEAMEDEVAALFKLKTLDLRGNRIADLGSWVGSMMSLTYLDAGNNFLREIPRELSRCTALEHLDVSGGQVRQLDDGLSKLTRLRWLRVQDHCLREIPASFGSLTDLEELRLDNNRLVGLPNALEALTKMRYATFSGNCMEAPPGVTRRWPVLRHLVLSRNPLKSKTNESQRLLQAAKQGQEAMHKGAWEEAVGHLGDAALEYDRTVINMSDRSEIEFGGGMVGDNSALPKAHPHEVDTFHHRNLGVACLEWARELERDANELGESIRLTGVPEGSVGGKSYSTESIEADDITEISLSSSQRTVKRCKERALMAKRNAANQQFQASIAAWSYADNLEQLTWQTGKPVGVWLGRAAAAASAGDPASAVYDLERAAAELRGNSKVRMRLAQSRIELGQYERGLADCQVSLDYLAKEECLLEQREADENRRKTREEEEIAAHIKEAEVQHRVQERIAARDQALAEAAALATVADATGSGTLTTTSVTNVTTALSSQPGLDADPTTVEEEVSAEQNVLTATRADVPQHAHGDEDKEIIQAEFEQQQQSSPHTLIPEREEKSIPEKRNASVAPPRRPARPVTSIARAEIARTREIIKSLISQAEEGLVFVQKSVDLADMRRGFAFTRHDVPVRDLERDREELLQGRSRLRDRSRRVMAVKAAEERTRARDVALMERAIRQASSRHEVCRRAKLRKEAILAKFREAEEEWERAQEAQTSVGAADIFIGEQAAIDVNAQELSPASDSQVKDKTPDEEKVLAPAITRASAAKQENMTKAKPSLPKSQDRDVADVEAGDREEDEEDEELKTLMGRAGRGNRSAFSVEKRKTVESNNTQRGVRERSRRGRD